VGELCLLLLKWFAIETGFILIRKTSYCGSWPWCVLTREDRVWRILQMRVIIYDRSCFTIVSILYQSMNEESTVCSFPPQFFSFIFFTVLSSLLDVLQYLTRPFITYFQEAQSTVVLHNFWFVSRKTFQYIVMATSNISQEWILTVLTLTWHSIITAFTQDLSEIGKSSVM
jgi:hypothetical protein